MANSKNSVSGEDTHVVAGKRAVAASSPGQASATTVRLLMRRPARQPAGEIFQGTIYAYKITIRHAHPEEAYILRRKA